MRTVRQHSLAEGASEGTAPFRATLATALEHMHKGLILITLRAFRHRMEAHLGHSSKRRTIIITDFSQLRSSLDTEHCKTEITHRA